MNNIWVTRLVDPSVQQGGHLAGLSFTVDAFTYFTSAYTHSKKKDLQGNKWPQAVANTMHICDLVTATIMVHQNQV